jgi:4-carboxymuconolactone decarboxylase
MAPHEQAPKNHSDLFPGHVSTLAVSDPELIETFDNFAFDEVLHHGNLDARTRLMVQLASMIAGQVLREYSPGVCAVLVSPVLCQRKFCSRRGSVAAIASLSAERGVG